MVISVSLFTGWTGWKTRLIIVTAIVTIETKMVTTYPIINSPCFNEKTIHKIKTIQKKRLKVFRKINPLGVE